MEVAATARPYRQVARAAATEETKRRIVAAFADALMDRWLDEITLDEIARQAGTTRQTVIRLFGGKEDLLRAVADRMKGEIDLRRALAPNASVHAVTRVLAADYEAVGDTIIRLLAQEERHPDLAGFLNVGRKAHRAWVAETFAAHLRDLPRKQAERRINALVTLTDVYVWKLLRRDMRQGQAAVAETMAEILNGYLGEKDIP